MSFSRVKLTNLEILLVIWQILHLTCVCSMNSAAIYEFFSGKIDKFGNLTGYLTNCTPDLCLFYT